MSYQIKQPILLPSAVAKALQSGISEAEISKYLPAYLYNPNPLECGAFKYFWLNFIQTILITIVRLILRPRSGSVGRLDIKEVEAVYNREAKTYDFKHHLTTRGMDTAWRRWAAWAVVSFLKNNLQPRRVLDLCTGTGLTVAELVKTARQWSLKICIIALDYNQKMIEASKQGNISSGEILVDYIQGDAMDLLSRPDGIVTEESFDAITQVFGIGGISDPLRVFDGVLKSLQAGGQYFLVDMHQPISGYDCELPILGKWFSFPRFETLAYNNYTMPVVLNRLWGWRDTTLDFYQLPLVTYQDDYKQWWGFEVVLLEMESQRWWLGLPLMPIAKSIVKKISISEEEALKRQKLLEIFS